MKERKRKTQKWEREKKWKRKNEKNGNNWLWTKVVLEILGHLDDPRDLARAGQVCQSWNECSQDASLWRRLPLSHWEFGVWRFHPVEPVDLPSHLRLTSDEEPQPCQLYDDLVSSLLPAVICQCCLLTLSGAGVWKLVDVDLSIKVGSSVQEISLASSRISMLQLQEILQVL